MKTLIPDYPWKPGHPRRQSRRTAALIATLAMSVCTATRLDAAVIESYPPRLEIAPATLLTWPDTPLPCMIETAPALVGPWTPCAGECSDVVGGWQRMYVAPDEQAKCFRLASTLLYKDFVDLSGWNTADTRIRTTVTNDDVLLHVNLMSATPIDDWVNWGGSIYPIGFSVAMPTNGTLELRCDVVRANQDDAFASVVLWRSIPQPYNAYGFSKDQNEVIIWKLRDPAFFHTEQVAIKNENITLSLALTPRGPDLEIRTRVFDRDNNNALLWERVVLDTPAVDPTVPNGAWKGFLTYPDLYPAPYIGTGFFPIIACSYWNPQRAPRTPGAEVIFDSFTLLQYEVDALEVEPASLLSWTEDPVACRIVETATSLSGPWTRLPTGCNNLANHHYRTFVPANEQARFFRLGEGSSARITSWPTALTVGEGTNITLRVEATGPDPLSYVWRFNGEVIEGITGDSLTIDNAEFHDQGEYVVTLSDACGSVTTDPLILTVLVPPTIVAQPQSQTVRVGDTVTFSVTVTNTATLPITYGWRKGLSIVEMQVLHQVTSSFTITNVQLGNAANYRVSVSNPAFHNPGYLSEPATLTVEP